MSFQTSNHHTLSAGKGKGCSALIKIEGQTQKLPVFMAGVGVTNIGTSPAAQPSTLKSLMASQFATFDWVSNKFYGYHPAVGQIQLEFKTIGNKKGRSTATIVGKKKGSLLPGTIVNSLFFVLKVPSMKQELVNSDPMMLHSESDVLSASVIKNDPRYKADPVAFPSAMQSILKGKKTGQFLAAGIHEQPHSVTLHPATDVSKSAVAHLQSSKVEVIPHYGLDVTLSSSSEGPGGADATVSVTNLTDRSLELVWHCDTLGAIRLNGAKKGKFKLAPRSAEKGKTKHITLKSLLGADRSQMSQTDCLMFSVQNIAGSLPEFVSGYLCLALDGTSK